MFDRSIPWHSRRGLLLAAAAALGLALLMPGAVSPAPVSQVQAAA